MKPTITIRRRPYIRAECECGFFDDDTFTTVAAAKRAALKHFANCGAAIYVTREHSWNITKP